MKYRFLAVNISAGNYIPQEILNLRPPLEWMLLIRKKLPVSITDWIDFKGFKTFKFKTLEMNATHEKIPNPDDI